MLLKNAPLSKLRFIQKFETVRSECSISWDVWKSGDHASEMVQDVSKIATTTLTKK